jgi:hypothetical protein
MSTFDFQSTEIRRIEALRSVEEEFIRVSETTASGASIACETLQRTLEMCTAGVAPLPPVQYTDADIQHAYQEHEQLLRDIVAGMYIQQQVLIQQSQTLIALMRSKRVTEFEQVFDATAAAVDIESGHATSCTLCSESVNKRLLRMRCCGNTLCYECLRNNTMHNMRDSTAACIYCRSLYIICRPAPRELTPPPSLPISRVNSSPPRVC